MKKSNNQPGQTANQETLGLGGGVKSREQDAREPKRPPRQLMSQGMNLDVDESLLDRENFSYRWFAEYKDKGGRISQAKAAYWEHVTDAAGSNITRNGGGGDAMYFMQLPMQYHKEDLELKKRRVQATMDEQYRVGEGQYIPEGNKSVINRENSDDIA